MRNITIEDDIFTYVVEIPDPTRPDDPKSRWQLRVDANVMRLGCIKAGMNDSTTLEDEARIAAAVMRDCATCNNPIPAPETDYGKRLDVSLWSAMCKIVADMERLGKESDPSPKQLPSTVSSLQGFKVG